MPIIQGRSGDSLAGIYDIVGGSYDVARLAEGEVALVHEMGSTITSERMRTDMRIVESLAVAQNTVFEQSIDDLPGGPFRIQSATLFAGNGTISHICLSSELGDGSRGIPLAIWNAGDPQKSAGFRLGGVTTAYNVLIPSYSAFPILALGEFQGNPNQQNRVLRIRGTTAAFGAGTTDIRAMLMVTHTHIPGGAQQPRSWGLPIPSW